jgi:putative oxidoreductase
VSNKFGEQYYDLTLSALRFMAGVLFLTHGGQKLFGWFGAEQAFTAWWPVGVAGVIEFFGGLAIALGVGTRYVAFLAAGEMAVAWASGGGRWTLEAWWQNRMGRTTN